jgi:hypothetical protein
MILISCPSCQRKLKLADNLAGKQIRCPACQNVFRVPAPTAELAEPAPPNVAPRPAPRPVARPAPPPPLPAQAEPLETLEEVPAARAVRPAPRRLAEPEEDFEELAEAGADLNKGYRVARRGAGALWFAVGVDVAAWLLFAIFMFTSGAGQVLGNNPNARASVAVTAVLSVLYFIPVIFMGVAAILLGTLRGRGMVITGCVMAFIAAVQLLPYTGLWGFAIAAAISGPNIQFGRLILPMLVLTACVLGLVGSISAGIRGLVTLSKPAVKAAYLR